MTLLSGMWDGQSECGYSNKLLCSFPSQQSRPGRHNTETKRRGVLHSFLCTKNNFPFSLLFWVTSNLKYAICCLEFTEYVIMVMPLKGQASCTTKVYCFRRCVFGVWGLQVHCQIRQFKIWHACTHLVVQISHLDLHCMHAQVKFWTEERTCKPV